MTQRGHDIDPPAPARARSGPPPRPCGTLLCALLIPTLAPRPAPAQSWHLLSAEQVLTASKDPLRRETAALVLGHAGARTAVPALVERMAKDSDPWVRARCAEALGLIGADEAIAPLSSALAREKAERVRRTVAMALVRLGQRVGLDELTWQLRSGTNHARAETMAFFSALTGRPLGQSMSDWWSYLAARGYTKLTRRPRGQPAPYEIPGTLRVAGDQGPWQLVTCAVVRLPPTRAPVSARVLRDYERMHGPIPDGSLLLLETRWADAPAPKPPRKASAGDSAPPAPVGPGLAPDGLSYLLRRAPRLLGVGIDAPALDLPQSRGAPVRTALLAKQRVVVEGLGDLTLLNATGTRVLLFRSAHRAHLLALLP